MRTIPRSIQKLFGIDKRLAHAEIVAIKREVRASRASRNHLEMARVVQVPFACCGPCVTIEGFQAAMRDYGECGTRRICGLVQETRAADGTSSLLGVC